MSVTTSDDPVATVKALLDATTDSDFTGSKPAIIERQNETEWRLKLQQSENALYVHTPTEGDTNVFAVGDSDHYEDVQVVQIEAWTPTDNATAHTIARDMHDYLWNNTFTDNNDLTAWRSVHPVTSVDYRAEARMERATQYRAGFQVRLDRLGP